MKAILYEALLNLRQNYDDDEDCWCEVAIGNPMCKGHSLSCVEALRVTKKYRKAKREENEDRQ